MRDADDLHPRTLTGFEELLALYEQGPTIVMASKDDLIRLVRRAHEAAEELARMAALIVQLNATIAALRPQENSFVEEDNHA